MKFLAAPIREQGVNFTIVAVQKYVVDNRYEAGRMIQSFQTVFPGVPIILMAQDTRGVPTYYGRTDIVRFLANVPLASIPWREYTLS